MKPIQVGLLGMGTVGSGTFNVLQRNQEEIQVKHFKKLTDGACLIDPGTDGLDLSGRLQVLQRRHTACSELVDELERLHTEMLAESEH